LETGRHEVERTNESDEKYDHPNPVGDLEKLESFASDLRKGREERVQLDKERRRDERARGGDDEPLGSTIPR